MQEYQPFPVGAKIILTTDKGAVSLRVVEIIPVLDFKDNVRYSYEFKHDEIKQEGRMRKEGQ